MSYSLSLLNRMLTCLGIVAKKNHGSSKKKSSYGTCQKNRHLVTENLEERNLLSILTWSPHDTTHPDFWDADTDNWINSNNEYVAWGDGIDDEGLPQKAKFDNSNIQTIKVSGTVRVEAIEFDRDGYNIINVTTGSKLIGSVLDIYVASGCNAIFSIKIADGNSPNYVNKWENGTLILNGDNEYQGQTTIERGTLIATTPDSLPKNPDDSYRPIRAKSIGDQLQGYGYHGVEHDFDGTQDPHSTLVVQGKDNDAGRWNATQIDTLLNRSGTVFEQNTNFGITVSKGEEFTFIGSAEHPLMLGDPNNNKDVGVVKLGAGKLLFGSGGDSQYSGPFSIYEGTLIAAPEQNTFSCYGGDLYSSLFINNDAILDLNGSASNTNNAALTIVSDLHGERRAIITDNSSPITFHADTYDGIMVKSKNDNRYNINAVYSGTFKQGQRT
jgi:autotransporter-associated beta strand protein